MRRYLADGNGVGNRLGCLLRHFAVLERERFMGERRRGRDDDGKQG